jgi:hypothetical protein
MSHGNSNAAALLCSVHPLIQARSLQIKVTEVLHPSRCLLFAGCVAVCCCNTRSSSHLQIAFINEVPLFYQDRDGHWFPTLRILHQYPGKGTAPGAANRHSAGHSKGGSRGGSKQAQRRAQQTGTANRHRAGHSKGGSKGCSRGHSLCLE